MQEEIPGGTRTDQPEMQGLRQDVHIPVGFEALSELLPGVPEEA